MKTCMPKLLTVSFILIAAVISLCGCSKKDGCEIEQLIYKVDENTNPENIIVRMDMSDFNCQYIDVYVGSEDGELVLSPNFGALVNNDQFETSIYYLNNLGCYKDKWYSVKEKGGTLHFSFPMLEDPTPQETIYEMGALCATRTLLRIHRNILPSE